MIINNCKIDLYNQDCFKVFSNLKDGSVHLAIVDPPYGISMKNSHSDDVQDWDKFEKEEFVKFTTKWLNELYRVLTPNGSCWIFFGPTMIHEMFDAIAQTKFHNLLENWICYARNKGRGASKKLKSLREDIFHLVKDPKDYTFHSEEYLRRVVAPYVLKGGEKRGWDYRDGVPMRYTGLGNIMAFSEYESRKGAKPKGWVPDISTGEPLQFSGEPTDVCFFTPPTYHHRFEKQVHTCQKPVQLLTMLILMSSKMGETVIDPFMGSGSTGVAAVIGDRNFIGIEMSTDVFNKAKNWLENINFREAEKYLKDHISSSEENSKFHYSKRDFMPKLKKLF